MKLKKLRIQHVDTNRDELLKSFCSFTSDLIICFKFNLLIKKRSRFGQIYVVKKDDKKLKHVITNGSTIKRESIIPFALSQGGDYSRHNLYVEVTNTIKKNGHSYGYAKIVAITFISE